MRIFSLLLATVLLVPWTGSICRGAPEANPWAGTWVANEPILVIVPRAQAIDAESLMDTLQSLLTGEKMAPLLQKATEQKASSEPGNPWWRLGDGPLECQLAPILRGDIAANSGDQRFRINLQVAMRGGKDRALADKIAAEFARQLEQSLRELTLVGEERHWAHSLQALQSERAQLDQLRQAAVQRMAELRSNLPAQPKEATVAVMVDFQKHEHELAMQLAGLDARAAVLQESIARAQQPEEPSKAAEKRIRALEQALSLRRKAMQIAKAQVEAAALSHSDLVEAEVQAALAESQLQSAVQEAAHPHPDRPARLQDELVGVFADRAECVAKSRYVAEQLKVAQAQYRQWAEIEPQLAPLEGELAASQLQLAENRRQLLELERERARRGQLVVQVLSTATEQEFPPAK